MFGKKKKDFLELSKIIFKSLDERIRNRELNDYFREHLRELMEENYFIVEANASVVKLVAPFSKDKQSLTMNFIPDIDSFHTIDTLYTTWNNHFQEHVSLTFDNEVIKVVRNEVTNYVNSTDGKPSSTRRKDYEAEYVDNVLVKRMESEILLPVNILDGDYSANITVTFAHDQEAVITETKVSSDNRFDDCGTTYALSLPFNEAPFNTRDCDNLFFMYGSSYISKEEFEKRKKVIDEKNEAYKLSFKNKKEDE